MRVCPECGHETEAERCPDDGRITLDHALLEESDPWAGRTIAGKYRIEARVGRGGMGSVYRARHTDTDGKVAVKVLHASIRGDAQAIKRFHLEAQNAAGLNHSHTIRVTDFGVEGETPYLVMEYLQGQPLSTLMRGHGALPWPRAVKIISGVLKSLWEAHEHERRIVHRDIKPQNVFLVDEHGEPDFVKVVDFGISRSLESQGADTVGPIGTPHYMAPEQWRGQDVDGRADLYSCGCMLYEMLAGRPPFETSGKMAPAERLATLASKHLNQVPERLKAPRGDELPRDLVEVVHELLSKDPGLRLPTASAVIRRLDALAGNATDDDVTVPYVTPESGRLVVETDQDSSQDTQEYFGDTLATNGAPALAVEDLARQASDKASDEASSELQTTTEFPQASPRIRYVIGLTLAVAAIGAALWASSAPDIDASRAVVRDAEASPMDRSEAVQHLLAHSRTAGQAPDLHDARLAGVALSGVVLATADLKQADLAEADLRKSDLTGADLRRAKLTGANLRGAVLRRADLRGADLRGAVLTDTVLEGSKYNDATNFPEGFDQRSTGAHGPEARLGGVDLRGADLRGTSFRDANLMRANLREANLQKAGLSGANIRGAALVDAVLRDADLSNTDLRDADLSGADLRGANLDGINLRGARYSAQTRWPAGFEFRTSGAAGPEADLKKANLEGADLKGADLRRADVRQARLQGADLRQAKLEDARFAGALYDGQTRWPSGFEPTSAGALRSDGGAPTVAVAEVQGEQADAGASEAADAGASEKAAARPEGRATVNNAKKAPPVDKPRRPTARVPVRQVAAPPPSKPVAEAVAETAPEPAPAKPPTAEPPAQKTPPAAPSEPPLRPFTDRSRRSYVEADLRNGDLSTLDLSGADLRWAQYNRRTRWPTGFAYKRSGALGPGAILAGKVMRDASLRGVDLRRADLRKTDLRGADLRGCGLGGADLRGALLHGTNLSRARLKGARLQGARFSTNTRWPTGFVADAAGAKLEL